MRIDRNRVTPLTRIDLIEKTCVQSHLQVILPRRHIAPFDMMIKRTSARRARIVDREANT